MTFPVPQEKEQESLPLKRYVAAFFRYRRLIVLCTITGTLLGLLAGLLFLRDMKVWDGTKVIRVRSPWTELETLTGDPTAVPRRETFYVEAEIAQFYDQTILQKVVDRCGLAEQQQELYHEFLKTLQGRIRRWIAEHLPFLVDPTPPTREEFREAAVRVLGKSLTIEPTTLARRATPVLSIQYYNPDRAKVAPVIESLITAYQEQKRQDFAEGRAARKQRELFEMRFAKLKAQFERQRAQLEREYKKLGLPFDSDFTLLVNLRHQELLQQESRLANLESQIQRLKAQKAQLQAQLASLGEWTEPAQTGAKPGDTLELSRLLDRYDQYNKRVTELELQLKSPDVATSLRKHLQAQLKSVRREMQALRGKILELRRATGGYSPEALRLQWELAFQEAGLRELIKQRDALKQEVAEKRNDLELLQADVSRLSLIRQEFHRVRDRYEQELLRREEREIYDAARKEIAYLEEVTKKVKISEKPRHLQRLSRTLMVVVSFFGSLLIGCCLAFFFGVVVDSSFHSSEEAEKALGVPVLALVPEVRRGFWRRG